MPPLPPDKNIPAIGSLRDLVFDNIQIQDYSQRQKVRSVKNSVKKSLNLFLILPPEGGRTLGRTEYA